MRDFPVNPSYLLSAHRADQAPPDRGLELAFAGRSNVGKSSAINAICGRNALARISKTPGRTQALNFFDLDGRRRLVDMPGYGYAKVPLAMKRRWERSMEEYLQGRESLRGLILIMDVRHPLKPFDRQILHWAEAAAMPVHILLTKADKLSRNKAAAALAAVRRELKAIEVVAGIQLFSALNKAGVEEARERVLDWLEWDAAQAEA